MKFTEDHEWIRVEKNNEAVVGITQHAVDELGEIVFVDLKHVGSQIIQMDEFGSVESVKTVSSLFLPVTGEIIAINTALVDNPALVNDSPYDEGWLIRVRYSDPKELDDLMTEQEYNQHLANL